jgi:hypothetical protein
MIAATAITGLLNLVFRPNEALLGIAPHADGGIAGIQQTNDSECGSNFHTGILIIRLSDAIKKNVLSHGAKSVCFFTARRAKIRR